MLSSLRWEVVFYVANTAFASARGHMASALPRSLLATPDCGLAFQPCCAWGDSCTDPSLTCIAREGGPLCEPCGTPFSQPCPTAPYWRQTTNVQCRPCGVEWQPCCADLEGLCGNGYICYAEQDRCVVSEYVSIKEDFFPGAVDGADRSTSLPGPICGGLNDPPCMETTVMGPIWNCDDGLNLMLPLFLCMTSSTPPPTATENCGMEQQVPCVDGCGTGYSAVQMQATGDLMCIRTFSLDSTQTTSVSMDDMPMTAMPSQPVQGGADMPAPMPEPEVTTQPAPRENMPDNDAMNALPVEAPAARGADRDGVQDQSSGGPLPGCGEERQRACTTDPGCACGLLADADGICQDSGVGCLNDVAVSEGPGAADEQEQASDVFDQSGGGPLVACGGLGEAACKTGEECECGLLVAVDGTCQDTGVGCSELGSVSAQVPAASTDAATPRGTYGEERDVTDSSNVGQTDDGAANVDRTFRNPSNQAPVELNADGLPRCGQQGKRICDEEPRCDEGLLPEETGLCIACGSTPLSLPCLTGRECAPGLALLGDFCIPCGGVDEIVCCDRRQCGEDPSDTACKEGLFRAAVKLDDETEISERGDSARCVAERMGDECGLTGQPPCTVQGDARPCSGLATPSLDGTECVPCGRDGEMPCADRFKLCTGTLMVLFNEDGEPEACHRQMEEDPDAVRDQSGGPCGGVDEPWCTNGGPACVGRTIPIAGNMCNACGSVDQPRCTTDEPCDAELRLYKNECIACGNEGDRVCPTGSACNDALTNQGGVCLPIIEETVDEGDDVSDQSFGGRPDEGECGMEGTRPCPGQPACGLKLYLVRDNDTHICSSKQATQPYPSGENCGGVGQAVCNEEPHCKGDTQPIFPEGICIASVAQALNCGSLGNSPCDDVDCYAGLDIRGPQDICAPSSLIPCGIRGMPVCVMSGPLCRDLLAPSFPEMICADTPRSANDAPLCGTLGQPACVDLECVSPMVVHPSTKVCVPEEGEPCGAAGQAQCFWPAGARPCNEGLEAREGMCSRAAQRAP